MKTNKRAMKEQRRRLDFQMSETNLASSLNLKPRTGWIKSIREALGMTSKQLAKKMKLKDPSSILAYERREQEQKITLEVLDEAAKAMGCDLVYAFVPKTGSLESLLDVAAQKKASQIVKQVSQSMELENQSVSKTYQESQIKELADELKEKLDSRLWD